MNQTKYKTTNMIHRYTRFDNINRQLHQEALDLSAKIAGELRSVFADQAAISNKEFTRN
jgi:hypothetical protein